MTTTKVEQAPHSAIGRDVARVMTFLARAVRSRPLYAANNEILVNMMKELEKAFQEVFKMVPELALKVRPDALVYEEEIVYQDTEPQHSLPFALYRDGIRRLEFVRDLEGHEIEVLLSAAFHGMSGRSMEDDVVSYLWRHQLQHIKYVSVDAETQDQIQDADLQAQIEALLRAIYGDSDTDDVGPKSINLDSSDMAAKAIADGLDLIEEMAPGFHPTRELTHSPAYATRALAEVGSDTEQGLTTKVVEDALEAMAGTLGDDDRKNLGETLLRVLDASILNEDLMLAARVVFGMRNLPASEILSTWIANASSEARIRQVTVMCQTNPLLEDGVRRFVQAWGKRAVPALLGTLASFTQPEQRRRFADLALELGIDDVMLLRELLTNEQGYVAREALYLMASLGQLKDRFAIKEVQNHPRPQVRLALLGVLDKMAFDVAQHVITDMLRDPEPRVQVAAADELSHRQNDLSVRAIENVVDRPEFDDSPLTVKRAFLRAYAVLHQNTSIDKLSGYISGAEGWRVKRGAEETADAAIYALASLRTQAGVDALKKAALSRNKAVREPARAALEKLKGGKA